MERDPIKENILDVLPNLTQAKLDAVLVVLETLGVEQVSDLDPDLIAEADLVQCLPMVCVRKLLREWKHRKGKKLQPGSPTEVTVPIASTSSVGAGYINFGKLTYFERLNTDVKLLPKERRVVVNDVVAQVLNQMGGRNPGRQVWRAVSELIIDKYPNHFRETDLEGNNLCNGFSALLQCLEHRCENERRGEKRMNVNDDDPIKKIKSTDEYGCIEWCVMVLPEGVTKEMLEETRLRLTEMYKTGPTSWNLDLIAKEMDLSYALQRELINSKVECVKVKEMWPFLMEPRFLLAHFERLTGVSPKEALLNFSKDKLEKTKKFFTVRGRHQLQCLGIEIAANKAKKIVDSCKPDILAVFNMVAVHFKEDFKNFITVMDESSCTDDVEDEIQMNTPVLVALGSSVYTARTYHVVVENRVLLHSPDILTAVSVMFAMYFVFNIKYNAWLTNTLEFIQRCVMKINPSTGSKTGKNSVLNCSKRVVDTIRELSEFFTLFEDDV